MKKDRCKDCLYFDNIQTSKLLFAFECTGDDGICNNYKNIEG